MYTSGLLMVLWMSFYLLDGSISEMNQGETLIEDETADQRDPELLEHAQRYARIGEDLDVHLPSFTVAQEAITAKRSRSRRELTNVDEWSSLECGHLQTKCADDIECVHLEYRCNNASDCADSSDERNCDNSTCPGDYFRCSTGQCVSLLLMCDSIKDCITGEDETYCGNASLTVEHPVYFQCNSGQYVPYFSRCNPTIPHFVCLDGSDLENCENVTCSEDLFRCSNGFCFKSEHKCDNVTQCPDGEDEEDCNSETKCGDNGFMCGDGQCKSLHRRCDVTINCVDGSDEQGCETYTCPNSRYKCNSGGCIRRDRRCDGIRDCPSIRNDSSDEEHCPLSQCSEYRCRSGQCLNRDICSSFVYTCNKYTDPTDHCGITVCSSDYFGCGDGKCLHHKQRCNNITDCPNGADERYCGQVACRPDQIDCQDGNCIPDTLGCDGYDDCLNGRDEANCSNRPECPLDHRACTDIKEGMITCVAPEYICDKSYDCLLREDERQCYTKCPDKCLCVQGLVDCSTELKHITDNSTDTTWPFEDTFVALGNADSRLSLADVFGLVLSHSGLTRIPSKTFIYIPHLQVLDLSYNSIRKLSIADFNGLYRLAVLNLSFNRINSIEGLSFAGLRVYQLHLEHNSITLFDTDLFNGLAADGNIYTDAFKFCCVRPDHLPQQQCFPHADQFSSCDDLIKNVVLRVLMWFIGIFAFLGNVISLYLRLKQSRTVQKMSYHIFVINLCVSDFLTGAYMILIATVDEIYRGRYITEDEAWRNSSLCSFAGVLAVASSESSVFFISLITIDRGIISKFPFGQWNISTRLALALSVCMWCLSIVLAIIPLIFTAYFDSNYYGLSGVCLSLPLTTTAQAGWEYSIFIYVFLNFVLFIMIGAGQVYIFYNFNSTRKQTQIAVKRHDGFKVAKRLLVVTVSDFLCWVPIGCMCLLTMTGTVITPDVYAFVVIFVLPINSVLNPFLYTLVSALC